MDRFSRFHRRSLRDVLVDQGVITPREADDLAESAYEAHETFGHAVVDAGHLTSWELAKVVGSVYNLPVLPLAGFDFDSELVEGIPAATLLQHQVLPVGRFGNTWSFAVIEPPNKACIAALRETCGSSIYFFVVEAEALQKLMLDHVKVVDSTGDRKWQSIFDVGDQRVRDATTPESGAA